MRLSFLFLVPLVSGCSGLSWLMEETNDGIVPAVEAGKVAAEAFITTTPRTGVIFGGIAAALAAGTAILKIKSIERNKK
tara:strand:- start:712 stop:948 length:237 start_codon:yes stop_codon:yes gene_type:complete